MGKILTYVLSLSGFVLLVSCAKTEDSKTKAGRDAINFEAINSNQFRVTCQDSVTELRDQQEIVANKVCLDKGYVLKIKTPSFYTSENGKDNNCFLAPGVTLRLANSEVPRLVNDRQMRVSLGHEADVSCKLPEGLVLSKDVEIGQTDGKVVSWGILPTTAEAPASELLPATFALEWLSDTGDYIGGGLPKVYTPANAMVRISSVDKKKLSVTIDGFEYWNIDIAAPKGEELSVKRYENVSRYPFQADGMGLSLSGEGRGCNTLSGSVDIKDIAFDEKNLLSRVELYFVQNCEAKDKSLSAHLVYDAKPALNSIVISGQKGDYISGGKTRFFTPDNAAVTLRSGSSPDGVSISVNGNPVPPSTFGDWWTLNFTSNDVSPFGEGIFLNAARDPFQGGVQPGLSVSGGGAGCNKLSGSFRVYKWKKTDAQITYFADFIQYCDKSQFPSYGSIRWIQNTVK